MQEEGKVKSSQGPGSSLPPHFSSSQHALREEPTPPQPETAGVTCTVDGLRHGGREDAGQPGARPELQHCATPEEVPLGQDVVRQEQGAPPHLEGERDQEQRWPAAPERPFRAVGSGRDLPTCLPTSSRGVAMVCSGQDGNRERKGHRENGDGKNTDRRGAGEAAETQTRLQSGGCV